MLLVTLGLVLCTASAYGLIPPSNLCYQHSKIRNACVYGNLTVAVHGQTFKPRDCNSQISVKSIETPPVIYINSTNTTERFTVLMLDLGPQGGVGSPYDGYLHWMVTNVSINSLPSYQSIPKSNVIVEYTRPLLMHGLNQPTLVQILVFRHQGTLRISLGELWITQKQGFVLSKLYSNTRPHFELCGPVAGTQYWVYDNSPYTPSAPPLPHPQPGHPVPPGQYIPPPGHAPPGQYVPPPGQYVPPSGQYVPPPGQALPPAGHVHPGSVPMNHYPKKNVGPLSQPMLHLFVPLVIFTVVFM